MSEAIAASEMYDETTQNRRIFMQLGLFGLLFLGLTLIADMAPAYGACSGLANLSGPLLPVAA